MNSNNSEKYRFLPWNLQFSYPREWAVCEQGDAFRLIVEPRTLHPNKPSVVLELNPELRNGAMTELLQQVVTNEVAADASVQIIASRVLPAKGEETRGDVLYRYRKDERMCLCEKLFVMSSKRGCLCATARCPESVWRENKGNFELLFRSLDSIEHEVTSITFTESPPQPALTSNVVNENAAPEELTQLLADDEQRTVSWDDGVYASINTTPLFVPLQPITLGTDGFSYFALYTEQPLHRAVVRKATVPELLTEITEKGLGLVINPGTSHARPFTFGDLWYARTQGGKLMRYDVHASRSTSKEAEEGVYPLFNIVFPDYARQALRAHMTYTLKVERPCFRVAKNLDLGSPIRYHCYVNVFFEDQADAASIEATRKGLEWYLRPDIAPVLASKADRELIELLKPI